MGHAAASPQRLQSTINAGVYVAMSKQCGALPALLRRLERPVQVVLSGYELGVLTQIPRLLLAPGKHCSPRHRMAFESRADGSGFRV